MTYKYSSARAKSGPARHSSDTDHCAVCSSCARGACARELVCQGAEVVEQRTVWLACVREARVAVTCGEPQPEWMQLVSLIDGSARVSQREHREGSAFEISIRRLVGGCVATPLDEKGKKQKGPGVMIAVSQAYEAGIQLQHVAWTYSQELRDRISTQTSELAKVRGLARRWRVAVIDGGPKRAWPNLASRCWRRRLRGEV